MTTAEKILKILTLCLEINNPDIPNVGKKKTAVFFEWSPHCNVVALRIHRGGWKRGMSPNITMRAYADIEAEKLDEMVKTLTQVKEGQI